MKLIFVRHGQTIFNTESRYQGHTDTELSELGRCQAAKVAERLKGERIAAVYSSDLSRARETAEPIAASHNLSVQTDDRLRECSFGDWEGLTVSEIAELYPELYESYRRDSIGHRAPNGERLEELQERVVCAVNRIAECHPDETAVVVVHGGPIRAFICHALGACLQTFRKIRLDNCGITTFVLESSGQWFLDVMNDTCHLEDLDVSGYDETSSSDRSR